MIMRLISNGDNDDKRLIIMIIQKIKNGSMVSKVSLKHADDMYFKTYLQPVIHGQRCRCA